MPGKKLEYENDGRDAIIKDRIWEVFQQKGDGYKLLAILIIVTLTAGETVRIICRKQQGINEISYVRMGLSFFAFLAYGALLIFDAHDVVNFRLYKTFACTTSAMIIAGIVYAIFGIVILIKGIDSKEKAKNSTFLKLNPLDPGKSIFFGGERFGNISQAKLRNLYDPSVLFILGLGLGAFHPIFGIPLLASSLFYWICLFIEISMNIEGSRRDAIKNRSGYLQGSIMKIIKGNNKKDPVFSVRVDFFQ